MGPGPIATLIIYAGHTSDLHTMLALVGIVGVSLALLVVPFTVGFEFRWESFALAHTRISDTARFLRTTTTSMRYVCDRVAAS